MAFAFHVREEWDILVTDDGRGFLNDGRRDYLEHTYKTKIMKANEFVDYLDKLCREEA